MTVNSDVGNRLVILVVNGDRHNHTPVLTIRICTSVQVTDMNT